MERTLVFTDAHNAGRKSYKSVLDTAIAENIHSIMFLGDVDMSQNYHEFLRFVDFASGAGITVKSIKGNHDQAWLDYANGLEDRCVATGKTDPSLKGDRQVTQYLQNLQKYQTVEDVLYAHAFPRGKQYSGQQGNRQIKGDHRFKYRDLWHYSFGTDNTRGIGFDAFDPDVIRWSFDDLLSKGLQYLIKGHEHVPKIWSYDQNTRTVRGGNVLTPGKKVSLTAPSIIQLGAFESGHYAVLEQDSSNRLSVEYRRLAPNQM